MAVKRKLLHQQIYDARNLLMAFASNCAKPSGGLTSMADTSGEGSGGWQLSPVVDRGADVSSRGSENNSSKNPGSKSAGQYPFR